MRTLICAMALATFLACASRTSPGARQGVRLGAWGNASETLMVDAHGARFQGICVSGTIETPLTYDEEGRFTASGSWKREGGRRVEGAGAEQRVRYDGYVVGEELTLTVVSDSANLLTTTLRYGVRSEARNCP